MSPSSGRWVGAPGLGSVPRNGKMSRDHKQSPFRETRNKSHLWSTPWAQGTPAPLSSPPFPVFKLCAFDHLRVLKISYAKSSWAPEAKDRGADTLASGTLSSPRSASLQFRLGEQKQEWQLFSSPRAYATFTDCLRAPLPARGEVDPFFCSVPPGRGLCPQGFVYTYCSPHPFHVACMLYSTAKV